jgi:glycosyltransferase involved in cell wall biosynthesis
MEEGLSPTCGTLRSAPMRICIVSSELAPFHGWGVGTATASLARALRDAGHDVHLLLDDLPGLRDGFEQAFPGIHSHIMTQEEFASALRQFPCECTRRPIVVHRRLEQLHDQFDFDCIEFNDFFGDGYMALSARETRGGYAGAVLGVHLHSPIFLLRDINGQPEHDLDIAMITHMEREAIRLADVLFAPSHAIVRRIDQVEGVAGLNARTVVIPYAHPLPDAPETQDLPHGGPIDQPEVLFFGRLETRKGVEILIDASRRLLSDGMSLRVRIVGVDTDCAPGRRSMREYLERLAGNEWPGAFVFEHNLPRSEIAARIRRAVVCCFPALWDNYPNACLEAMSLGACVVASCDGGMSELIEHGVSGLLVPSRDPVALADALRTVLANPALRAHLGKGARAALAKSCDPPTVARMHQEAIIAARARVQRPVPVPVPRRTERVCVIIPVHNLGSTLEDTLRSVRAQTRLPDEVIIVDDGSTDPGTIQALERARPGVTRIIRQTHRGLPAARNTGTLATAADWILPLDADDLLAPQFIARALECAARCPHAILITSHMTCFTDDPVKPEITFVPLGFVREILPAANIASSAIALVRREAVLKVGLYNERMTAYEDWELYCRLSARGYEGIVMPEPLILNRVRPNSMLRHLTEREDQHLRALILARHMSISPRPERTARIVLSLASRQDQDAQARALATRLVRENLRYRLADRATEVISAIGLKHVLKRALGRMEGRIPG